MTDTEDLEMQEALRVCASYVRMMKEKYPSIQQSDDRDYHAACVLLQRYGHPSPRRSPKVSGV